MNAHVQIALEEIAKQVQAIVKCKVCGNNYLIADDVEAEKRAYAMATNEWKGGAFRSAPLEEILHAMKSVLRDANLRCPSCG